MTRITYRLLMPSALVMLSACGGGGGGTPPQTLPPPPPAAAVNFPLGTSASFDAVSAARGYHEQAGTVTLDSTGVAGRGSGVSIAFDAASGTYTVADAVASASFTAADRSASGFLDSYAKQRGTVSDALQLFGNLRVGGPQAGAPVQLTYLSYGIWSHADGQTGETRKTYLLFGFPTASDMPRSGSAGYTSAVTGSILEVGIGGGESEVGGSASFNADFGSGAISTQLTLVKVNGQIPIGTFTGSGTLSGDQFKGSFSSSAPFFVGGSFAGGFFGPAAQEMGYAFSIRKHNPDPFAGASPLPIDSWVVGSVVGRKN